MIAAAAAEGLPDGAASQLSSSELGQWEAYIVARAEWADLLEAEIGMERAKRILAEDAAAAVTAYLAAKAAVQALADTWVAAALAARTP